MNAINNTVNLFNRKEITISFNLEDRPSTSTPTTENFPGGTTNNA